MAKKSKKEKKDLQEDLKESANKIWLAGLGALAAAEDEGSKMFRGLVERGEAFESRGKETLEGVKEDVEGSVDKAKSDVGSVFDRIESRVDEAVGTSLRRFGVPTRDEIATLTRRVEELTTHVERLAVATAAEAPAAKKTTTRRTAAKKPAAKKPAASKSTADTSADK
ncbi:MAG: phasin family protein [Acidobacteriota bacterium]